MSTWSIYLISNGTRTYIGSTTNIKRRLRQHNCELVGGAKATRRSSSPWKMVCYISGFENRSVACRWERILKCRARGLLNRLRAFNDLAKYAICPTKGNLPHYLPPPNLKFEMENNDTQTVRPAAIQRE